MPRATHLLFVGGGGMGSTELVYGLRANGTPCVEKPMINTWYPGQWPAAIRTNERKPAVSGLHELPTPKIRKRFLRTQKKMSDSPERFSLDPATTLAANMLSYFAFPRSHGIACVLKARSVEGLVSEGGLRDVVFLVRDPIQSYVSFAKPERHGRIIDILGGMESDDALELWGWSWNCLADEYLQAESSELDPVLVRYELVHSDLARVESPFLADVFASFRPNTNEVSLSERARQRIVELVGDRYERIYGEAGWEPSATCACCSA